MMDLEDNELHARILASVVAIAEEEAQKLEKTISVPVMKALGNMVVQYMEILARDLEMFAQHAGRKTVNMDDVLLSARRNPDVAAKLAPLVRELVLTSKKNKDEKLRRRKESKEAPGQRPDGDHVVTAADSLNKESPEEDRRDASMSVEKRQRK